MNVHGTPAAHPISRQCCLSRIPGSRRTRPHLRCGGEDSIYSLVWTPGEGARITLNSYSVTGSRLSPLLQRFCGGGANRRLLKSNGGERQRLVESDTIRRSVMNGWGHLSIGFGNAIEGERSAQRLVGLVGWGTAVPGGTIEGHHGGTSGALGRSRWEILKTMCWTQKVLIRNLAP